MTEPAALAIRRVRPEDAAAVAELSTALGYPATEAEIHQRIVALPASQAVFVACLGAEVAGWIDIALTYHLQSRPYALIGGLVVKETLRGQRIGRRLCEAAEAWALAQGVDVVRVTSRSTREDAHRFYLRDGYTDVKLSRVFEKKLS